MSRPPVPAFVVLSAAALILVMACAEGPIAPEAPIGSAPQTRVEICHRGDTGIWQLQTVSGNALAAHLAHGDGTPGGSIPGGGVFGAACETATVNRADLSVTKTDGVDAATTGGSVTYTIVVSNGGPAAATGAVLQDGVAAGLSKSAVACAAVPGQCASAPTVAQLEAGVALPTIASGQTYALTVTALVTATEGDVTNTATVTAPAGVEDGNPANDTASDTDAVSRPTADLEVTLTDGVATLPGGANTTYTLVVTNHGPTAADGARLVVFSGPGAGPEFLSVTCSAAGGAACPPVAGIPGEVTIPTLPAGGSVTVQILASVGFASFNVSASAFANPPAGTTDPNIFNNAPSDIDQVLSASVRIEKANSGILFGSVTSGTVTTYQVLVSNAGFWSADGAVVRDPAVTGLVKQSVSCTATGGAVCPAAPSVAALEGPGLTIPTFPGGSSLLFMVPAFVSATDGSVRNTATVTLPPGIGDPNLADNTSSDTDLVAQAAVDLTVSITDGVTEVTFGSDLVYTVVVTNHGPSIGDGSRLRVPMTLGLTKYDLTCTPGGGAISCDAGSDRIANLEGFGGLVIPSLPPGGFVTYRINAAVGLMSAGSVQVHAIVDPAPGVIRLNFLDDTFTDVDTYVP